MAQLKQDASGTYYEDKLSAQVRARLLFDRETDIEAANNVGVVTNEFLEKLAKQKFELEKQRNAMLKGIFVMTFLMFFVSNGQDLTLPYISIKLSNVPGLNALLGLLMAVFLLFAQITGISIGAYSGLMEAVAKKRSANTLIDPDIISASVVPFQMVFKVLNSQFNIYHPVHIIPKRAASLVYWLAVNFIGALFVVTALLIFAYTGYFLIEHVPNSTFGVGAKSIGFAVMAAAILLNISADWAFSQKIYTTNSDDSQLTTELPSNNA